MFSRILIFSGEDTAIDGQSNALPTWLRRVDEAYAAQGRSKMFSDPNSFHEGSEAIEQPERLESPRYVFLNCQRKT